MVEAEQRIRDKKCRRDEHSADEDTSNGVDEVFYYSYGPEVSKEAIRASSSRR